MMADEMDRQIAIEQQRARMQNLLRDANMALIVAVDANGQLCTYYMNCNPVEVLGLARALDSMALNLAEMGDDED